METRLQMQQENMSVHKSEVTLEVKMGEMGAQSMAVLFKMERIERRR